jgi:rod shape-determining protein MreD
MALRAQVEPHIEVHKYSALAVGATVLLALVLQVSLPAYFRQARLLDLPLLVTLYFGLSRRNPSTGLLLGMVIGLLQDAVSPPIYLGVFGIGKTLVGFGASSIGARLDVEHPMARALLTFAFFHGHQVVLAFTRRTLLQENEVFFSTDLLIASLINSALAVLLFPLLDRLRK